MSGGVGFRKNPSQHGHTLQNDLLQLAVYGYPETSSSCISGIVAMSARNTLLTDSGVLNTTADIWVKNDHQPVLTHLISKTVRLGFAIVKSVLIVF